MQRRKKPIRSPFVVTISIAAATASLAIACGGKVPDGGIGSSGGTSGVSTNPPRPVGYCTPETRAGDPCTPGEGSSCGESPRPLVCIEGTWRQEAIGNPPPPQPKCPEMAPLEGASCFDFTGQACTFVDTCATRPGAAPPDSSFTCVGGAWKRTSLSYVAGCPTAMPQTGDSCADCARRYPAECKYFDGSGCQPAVASCDAKTNLWSVLVSSCNPPPPDASVP